MCDLDPVCMTCSNTTTAEKRILYEQFKLACLKYKPSDIEVKDGKGEFLKIQRKEVLFNRQQMIDEMKEVITVNPVVQLHDLIRF